MKAVKFCFVVHVLGSQSFSLMKKWWAIKVDGGSLFLINNKWIDNAIIYLDKHLQFFFLTYLHLLIIKIPFVIRLALCSPIFDKIMKFCDFSGDYSIQPTP